MLPLHHSIIFVLHTFLLTQVQSSPFPADDLATSTLTVNGQLTTAVVKSFSNVGLLGVTKPSATVAALPTDPVRTDSPVLPPNANPIKFGLTSFGDSYAAGLGTGITTSDSCRQGQFSYGNILVAGAPEGTFHERRECSGALLLDVAQSAGPNQIDDWQSAPNSDVVTLSIGGNDLGFAVLVNACFLRLDETRGTACNEAIAAARDKLSGGGIQPFVETILVQIINKSGRQDLKVFLTGYAAFFNVDTEYCNGVGFDFWGQGNKEGCGGHLPCLTKELRRTINSLIIDLNRQLAAAVRRVRAEKGPLVHFIDPNPLFNGHRFCEVDDGVEVKDPDPKRTDTWFFLSAWPDNTLDNTLGALAEDIDPALGNGNFNTTALPPSSVVCGDTQDPANYFLCQMALVNEDATAAEHFLLQQQHDEIRAGNFSSKHVEWWKPTRYLKTFHPRTLGQKAYADLIVQASG